MKKNKATNNNLYKINDKIINSHCYDGMVWYSKQNLGIKIVKLIYAHLKANTLFKKFRSYQLEIISACLSQRNVIAILPTGYGKSLIYIIAGLVSINNNTNDNRIAINRIKVTIIISPLVALMLDQASKILKMGMNAIALTGDVIIQSLKKSIMLGKYSFIFVSPEKIIKNAETAKIIQSLATKKYLQRIVIDEIHCVTAWGLDFRRDYISMANFLTRLVDIPILGLTATTTIQSLKNIISYMNLANCLVFKAPMNRSNLKFRVIDKKGMSNCYLYFLEKEMSKC